MKKPTRRNQKRNFSRLATLPRYEQLENRQMLAGDSFWVYYGEGNKLFRSLNDGTQKQELMALTIQPGPVNADGIMVDLDRVNNKIYAIANQGHNPIHLYRSNLDGSNRELLNNSDSMGTILQGIAVNEQTGAVYVSPHSLVVRTPGSAPGGMLRITNNGQTVTPFSQKPWYVTDMEVDAANGHVYYAVWPSYGGGVPAGWAGIRRMNLDGSNDIGIFQTGGNGSFALDTANNRIWFASTYSSSLQNDKIYTINLTGGSFQEKATVAGYTFGDIDLSESKDGIVFSSFPKTGNPNPNARIQQLAFTSTTAVPLFDTPNISSGIELLPVTQTTFDLSQIVGGGDGRNGQLPGNTGTDCLDAENGNFTSGTNFGHTYDNGYKLVSASPFIDGVFVAQATNQINNNGVLYAVQPEDAFGVGFDYITRDRRVGHSYSTGFPSIGMHGGHGLTFDLSAFREAAGGGRLQFDANFGTFSSYWSIRGYAILSTDDAVLSAVISPVLIGTTRHQFSLQIPEEAKYLTLISGAAGDGITEDHGVWENPFLRMTPDPRGVRPTLDPISNYSVDEDSDAQEVGLSGISAGQGESQPLRVSATSSQSAIISNPTVEYTSPDSKGILRYALLPNQFGAVTITVTVEDGGPDGNLNTTGDNATFSRTFQVTVNPVNDAPTLNPLSNLTVARNAPLQTINLSGITAGGGESQPLRVSASSDNSALIPNPNVNYSSANNTGSISFTPVPNQAGVATITVTVEDGGLDGDLSTTGDNATITRTFTVSVGGSQWLYYLENGVLSRSSPDGSNPTALVQSTEQGWAIKNFDLDTVNNRIYYAEENGVTNSRILSVDMLGQNPIMISQNAAGKGNYSMAVDGLNQAVYLHSHDVPPLAPAGPFFEGRIQKISYQGVLALLPPVLWYVHDMEIDAAANTLYFTADVNSEGLFKCDLNGNAITSLSNDSGVMRNIAISRLRNKIIYTNVNDTNNTSSIFIMNPDGTEKVKLGDYVGAGIDDVELDDEAGLIYFATTLDGIFKTSLTTFAPVQVLPGEKKEIELYFASNTPPTIDVIGNRTVYRNAPQQTVSLSGITAGGGELQPLRVTASSNNTGLIPNPTVNYSSANTTGSLSFTPVANQTGTATITVTVEDGGFDGDLNTTGDNATFSRTFQVNVNRISDVPVLTNLGGDVSYRENVVTARLCNAVQVADADTQVFANGTLQIAIESGGESADRLWLTNSKYLTVNGNGLYFNGLLVGNFSGGTNGQPLEVTFNNRASVNRVQHVLRCVCFAHDSEAPQATQRLIAIQLNDGAGGQAAATKRVNVIPVDDRLALTGVPVTSTYTLNSTVIRIAPAAVLTDPDSPGFGGGSLRVRFTSAADSSNRLLLGGGFTIDANNNVLQNGVIIGTRNAGGGIGMTELQLSFNSKATREVVQQLMRGLSFKTVNGTSKSSRTIEFSLNNGDGGSNIATTRIDVA